MGCLHNNVAGAALHRHVNHLSAHIQDSLTMAAMSPRRGRAIAALGKSGYRKQLHANIGYGTDVRSGNNAQSVQRERTRSEPSIAVYKAAGGAE